MPVLKVYGTLMRLNYLAAMMRSVNALVDYDNAVGPTERNAYDAQANLERFLRDLASAVIAVLPRADELYVRLYGGWTTTDNQNSPRADLLLPLLSGFRKRIDGLRVKPTLVRSLVLHSDLDFLGTYRQGGQKMVDVMLSLDLIEQAKQLDKAVLIVSDDDDFVPACACAAHLRSRHNPLLIFRRSKKIAPNDKAICKLSAVISCF